MVEGCGGKTVPDFAKGMGQTVTVGAFAAQDGCTTATCGRLRSPTAIRWNRPACVEEEAMTHRLMLTAVGARDSPRGCGRSSRLGRSLGGRTGCSDLSCRWSVTLGLPTGSGLKRQDGGVTKTASIDRVIGRNAIGQGRGALPWTPRAVLQGRVPGQGRRAGGQPEQDRPGVLLCPASGAARRPAAEDRATRGRGDFPLRRPVGGHLPRHPD